jgi:hypothetical protein
MRKHGFPKIMPAVKGPKSVEEGVEFLKSFDIIVHPRCVHTIDELTLYSYEVDPLTGMVLPKLQDKNNNVIDALRYACEGARRAKNQKPKPERPKVRGERQRTGAQGWMAEVAWRSWLAAHKFLFWTLVERDELLHAIHWHKEASRELLILKPRRPKDLYDAATRSSPTTSASTLDRALARAERRARHARRPRPSPGATLWTGIPFHEVEFSDMPQISFKVRAVPLEWCREHLKLGEGAELIAASRPAGREGGRGVRRGAAGQAPRAQALEAADERRGREPRTRRKLDDIKFAAASPDDNYQWPEDIFKQRTDATRKAARGPA